MPIFEYRCRSCGKTFEELVFGKEIPACPVCHSSETEKLISRCSCHCASNGGDVPVSSADASSGGCAGCSGGNCAGCGH